jgi:hypothetical protein
MLECCCTLTTVITTGASREVRGGKKVNLCFIIVYSIEDCTLKIQMGMLFPILKCLQFELRVFGAVTKVRGSCKCDCLMWGLGGHTV